MSHRLLTYARVIQMICGVAVFVLGVWLWWRVFAAPQWRETKTDPVWFVILLVVPQVSVAVGSILQAVRRKLWPVALVLLGGAFALWFTLVAAQIAFVFRGDMVAVDAARANLVLLLITVAISLVNSVFALVHRHLNGGVEQIVGREPRERVSHDAFLN